VVFLKELAKSPEKLLRKEVKEAIESENLEWSKYTMAGLLSSLSRRAENFGDKEKFWISDTDGKGNRYYRLKERYRELLENYF